MEIACRRREILRRVPAGVTVVAAAKDRTPEEVRAAIRAGISHIGENYVRDAAAKRPAVPEPATWHMIGHLQRNKAHTAVGLFDWVQTVDSLALAEKIATVAALAGKTMPVLVQVNIGREPRKAGVLPEAVTAFVRELARFPSLHVRGLMAIPPAPDRPEDSRPHFRAMRRLFEDLRNESASLLLPLPGVGEGRGEANERVSLLLPRVGRGEANEPASLLLPLPRAGEGRGEAKVSTSPTGRDATGFDVLSMGMSADWEVAVEEGATMIRLGTALFGPRPPQGGSG